MNIKGFADIATAELGCSEAAANRVYKSFVNALTNELVSTKQAVIPGLGTLVVAEQAARPERQGRNPKTGEALTIPAQPAKKKVKFRATKSLKGMVQ